jgi:hypothetical protein
MIDAYIMNKKGGKKLINDTHKYPVQKLESKHILDINLNN